MARDSRLVQTAVIGHERSDVPVLLPTAAIELDQFRHVHGGDTFWCGLLLGGCGARLADKLYVDRQCHFQHYPQGPGGAPACRRRGIGEASADHLYVKRALENSLSGHGREARYSYPEPLGSLLDVDLDDGRQLRVHLDGQVPPTWGEGSVAILAAGVPLEPGTLSRCPYVYRVRLESSGAERRVWIGTESLARPTEWTPLTDCGWGPDGLVTETAARILRDGPAEPPMSPPQPLPEPVTRLIRGLESAQRAGTVEHVRRLCEGAVSFLAWLEPPARAEAEQALAEAAQWLAVHTAYQERIFEDLASSVREKRAWDARALLTQALTLTRRFASREEQQVLDAARLFLREKDHLPPTAPIHRPQLLRASPLLAASTPRRKNSRRGAALEKKARATRTQQMEAVQRVRSATKSLQRPHLTPEVRARKTGELKRALEQAGDALPVAELRRARSLVRDQSNKERTSGNQPRSSKPERPREQRPQRKQPDALSEMALASAAAAVRGVLKRTARRQGTVTWDQLREQLGSALPRMSEADRRQVIVLVDAVAKADEPLLSCVLAARDPQLAEAYRLSATSQGLQVPEQDRELLRDVIEADVRQTHDYWRHR
ncbi:hypothetical protein [Streptomyces sp. NPDC056512]|uniref:hypothetical protein n=1 Tax=Streptomyces sp. NPDC056512 TaxID=3345846 RepID=UPI0036989A15